MPVEEQITKKPLVAWNCIEYIYGIYSGRIHKHSFVIIKNLLLLLLGLHSCYCYLASSKCISLYYFLINGALFYLHVHVFSYKQFTLYSHSHFDSLRFADVFVTNAKGVRSNDYKLKWVLNVIAKRLSIPIYSKNNTNNFMILNFLLQIPDKILSMSR